MKSQQFTTQIRLHLSERTEVQRATLVSDNSAVIVKLSDVTEPQTTSSRLLHEYQITQRLNSEYTVRPISYHDDENHPLLVTEDNQMSSLERLVPDSGFELATFFCLAIEITRGIQDIHAKGIVHKDINSSNIIVSEDLTQIKLIDFEFATFIAEEFVEIGQDETLQGTLTHIAPEQTGRTNHMVTSRSDLYALGITLYQMLTGRLPFTSNGAAELIYSHIARPPRTPRSLNGKIPPALSNLVEKLLRKSPDERYQTANAVVADLEYLRRSITAHRNLDDFHPGAQESYSARELHSAPIKRQLELKQLINRFAASNQGVQLVHLVGDIGMGKEALARELYAPTMIKQGYFLIGRYNQQNQKLPFAGLVHGLKNLITQIVDAEVIVKEEWRAILQDAVKEYGQLLVNLIPALVQIIGEQPKIAGRDHDDLLQLTGQVISSVIRALTDSGKPVVLYFEGFQWAHAATLRVISDVLKDSPKHLTIIISTQPNPGEVSQHIDTFLAEQSDLVTTIELKPLSKQSILDWINLITGKNNHETKSLATQLSLLTQGNPKYLQTLLHEIITKAYLRRESDGTLSIDLESIRTLPAGPINQLLHRNIDQLNDSQKKLLQKLSILGKRFSLTHAKIVAGKERLGDQLDELINGHLLLKISDDIMFAHDQLQTYSYDMLLPAEAQRLHLHFARQVMPLDLALQQELVPKVEYLYHYNIASGLLNSTSEKTNLARLNLIVGKQLKIQAAFLLAEELLEHAIQLCESTKDPNSFEFVNELHFEYAQLRYLNGQPESGLRYFDNVVNNARSPIDIARVFNWRAGEALTSGDPLGSSNIALTGLRALGMKISKYRLIPNIIAEYTKLQYSLRGWTTESLLEIPSSKSPLTEAKLQMLGGCITPFMFYQPQYLAWVILKMMNISISEGPSAETPVAFALYGMILCAIGKFEQGTEFGKLSLAQIESIPSPGIKTSVNLSYALFIQHYSEHARHADFYFGVAANSVSETGDYPLGDMAKGMKQFLDFHAGHKTIPTQIAECQKQIDVLRDYGNVAAKYALSQRYQLLATLSDPKGDGVTLRGPKFSEDFAIDEMIKRKAYPPLCILYVEKMQLFYLAGDYSGASKYQRLAAKTSLYITGLIFQSIFLFYSALVSIAIYRGGIDQKRHLAIAKKSLKKLRRLAKVSADNYLSKALLIEAEIISALNPNGDVLQIYEAALTQAIATENLTEQALTYELIAKHYLRLKLDRSAQINANAAFIAYEKWGATTKSRRLAQEFKLSPLANVTQTSASIRTLGSQSDSLNHHLDLNSLTHSIKTLTANFDLNSLLADLLNIVQRNSGATRVLYLDVENNQWFVRAEISASNRLEIFDQALIHNNPVTLRVAAVEASLLIPPKPYLKNMEVPDHGPSESAMQSFLAIPIVRNSTVIGLVYLENNLMPNAFRSDQLQFLSLLCGQAGIAVENALAFESLKTEKNHSANIIENCASLICGLDAKGTFQFANPETQTTTGYSIDELIGENCWDLLYPEFEPGELLGSFVEMTLESTFTIELSLTTKQGDKRDIIWNNQVNRNSKGNITEVICFGVDVTEQNQSREKILNFNQELKGRIQERTQALEQSNKELHLTITNLADTQDQLIESKKMAALGGLVAGVAHEINTPLSVGVTGISRHLENTEELYRLYQDHEMSQTDLEKYLKQSKMIAEVTYRNLQRAATLVNNFKKVSIQQTSEPQRKFDLSKILHDSMATISTKMKSMDASITITAPDDFVIDSYPETYTLIITNLAINSLTHGYDSDEQPKLALNAKVQGNFLDLTFMDDGKGIELDHLEKIFEPFYTANQDSSGTGLGLNIVYNLVVQRLQGTIRCDSTPGLGTTFHISLPLVL